ncbi:MAG: ubiquinone/menaquinone biosynthesis C-methylase UbiE [Bradymonadia bacterium]
MTELRDNAAYYDKFSEGYEDRRHDGYHAVLDDMQARLVQRYARPSHRALEIGCGTGLLMHRLRDSVSQLEGVDISEGMLAHAAARGLSVQQSTAEELPFDDGSFDLVYSFKVLAHVQDIQQAVNEAFRVLAPGGHAVLEFYNPWSLRAVRKRIFAGAVAPGIKESEVYTRFDSPVRTTELFQNAGFEVLDHVGIMVVTPVAHVHRIPVVKTLFKLGERAATMSPLRKLGGFVSTVGRRNA